MSENASFQVLGGDARVAHVNVATAFVGATFNSFLFALATMQTTYYWHHYWKDDRLYLRCMVMLVAVLTTLHMVFYVYTLWRFLIPSHAGASGSGVTAASWLTYAEYTVDAMGILAVHTFYLDRLWTLSQNRLLVTILGILMLEVFALGMYISICAITIPTNSIIANVLARIVDVETALCASLAVTDVTMTTSLVTLFLQVRLSTVSMKSEHLIQRLIFYSLTTGVLTAISAIVALIMNLKFPKTSISTTVYDFGMNLYTCSFLSTLNMRQSLREKLVETGNGFNLGRTTMSSFLRFVTTPSGGTSTDLTTTANVTHAHAVAHRARYSHPLGAGTVNRQAAENTEQAIPGGGSIAP